MYTDIFNSLPDGILIVDKNCIVIDVNDAYLKISGYKTKDEVIGRDQNLNVLKLLGRESYLKKVMRTGKAIVDVNDQTEQTGNFIDNIISNQYISIFPLWDHNNEIIGAATIFRDLKMILSHLDEYKLKTKRLGNSIRAAHKAHFTFDDIVGTSKALEEAKNIARKIVNSELNILILGESGTGKELFAQAIHNASPQKDQPFVTINCPSLTDTLAESELFGYEEGSFSGAVKGGKIGLCEIADGGTLFLDEIGDLSQLIQAKILRLLESGEFLRVGGTKPIKVSIRVIAATNRDIFKLMDIGSFRRDLYYRLCNITVDIPPLRDRSEDVVHLSSHFINLLCPKGLRLEKETLMALCRYLWPGNIRELKNLIRSLSFLVEGDSIPLSVLPERIRLAPGDGSLANTNLGRKAAAGFGYNHSFLE
jgi:transcriptional regulator with PAS, ATPase and Fis domain